MAPLHARVVVPMPIQQRVPNLSLHRTLRRRLILSLIASLFLRPRRSLRPNQSVIPLLFVIPVGNLLLPLLLLVLRRLSTLDRTLRINAADKHHPLRIRRPDPPIRLRTHRRQRTPRRPHRPLRLIPRSQPKLRPSPHIRRIKHPLPIRREPPIRLPIPKRHLPFFLLVIPQPALFVIPQRTLFVIPQRSGGICFCAATTPQRHHPKMIHLRVLLQRHIHHREHHPLTTSRDLRIAHPLHRHQIRKRHRPLLFVIPQRS